MPEAVTLERGGMYQRYKTLSYTYQPSDLRLYLLLSIWNETPRAVPTEIMWEGNRTFRGVLEDYHCQGLKTSGCAILLLSTPVVQ
jgi:hypothetical protein